MSRQTGSCLCGAVRFEIDGNLTSPRFCHCEHCRKFAGTSPATWAMAKTSELSVLSGGDDVGKYNSGRGLRCFCRTCGSPVWFESLGHPHITAIPLGVLDETDVAPPQMHLWTGSMPTWCAIHDALPQHEKNP